MYNLKQVEDLRETYSPKEILRILLDDGWMLKAQRGSHLQLDHPLKCGKVTVPHPRKELDPKTVRSIFRQAGMEMPEA